jgi:CPA2 family monovalent cation:H+ antiporter-2
VIIEAANIETARIMLITTPASIISKTIVQLIKKYREDFHVVVRSQSLEQTISLHEKGVYYIVQPEFEAGLEFTRQALLHLDLPVDRIQNITDEDRYEHYKALYHDKPAFSSISQLQSGAHMFQVTWILINDQSPLIGTDMSNAAIREKTGATIAGIFRHEKLISNPGPKLKFEKDDMLGILGTSDQLAQFRRLFTS